MSEMRNIDIAWPDQENPKVRVTGQLRIFETGDALARIHVPDEYREAMSKHRVEVVEKLCRENNIEPKNLRWFEERPGRTDEYVMRTFAEKEDGTVFEYKAQRGAVAEIPYPKRVVDRIEAQLEQRERDHLADRRWHEPLVLSPRPTDVDDVEARPDQGQRNDAQEKRWHDSLTVPPRPNPPTQKQ